MVGESDILQISSATMITKKAQTTCILSLGVSKYFCPKHLKIFFSRESKMKSMLKSGVMVIVFNATFNNC